MCFASFLRLIYIHILSRGPVVPVQVQEPVHRVDGSYYCCYAIATRVSMSELFAPMDPDM